MQAWGLALDESHDVGRTQAREGDRSVAEPIGEKRVDERQVVDAGPPSQCAFIAQVVLERLCLLLNRRQSAWGDLLRKEPLAGGAENPRTVSALPHHPCDAAPVGREIAGSVRAPRMRRGVR